MLGIEKVPVSVSKTGRHAARLAACLLLCFCTGAAAEILTGHVVGIRDGDTFVLLDDSQLQHVIHPAGCDTPERGQPYYQKAKESLSEMIYGKQVVVDVSKLTSGKGK